MIKIGYYSSHFHPQANAAAVRSFWFINALEMKGASVSPLQAPEFLYPKNSHALLWRLFLEKQIGLFLFFKVLFSNFDKVILSSPSFVSTFLIHFACRLRGVPYILDIRDLYPEVFFSLNIFSQKSFIGQLLKFYAKILYGGAELIITVTDGCHKIIESYGAQNIKVIPNGYDRTLFKSDQSKSETFQCLFHGNLARFQNIDLLIELANSFKEDSSIKFLVAGYGLQEAKIHECPAIQFLGHLDQKRIAELVNQSHLGLSFRTDDEVSRNSFPVKIFEYIGSGLPVLAYPKGEATDFLEQHQLGLAVSDNVVEIKKLIERIKNNEIIFKKNTLPLSRQDLAVKFSELVLQS